MFKLFRKKISMHESLEMQMADNENLHPHIANLVSNGLSCDKLPNATGEFGSITNPIPVNGPLGEIKYLGKLRGKTGQSVFFHRIGGTPSSVTNNSVDIFEVVCLDGTQWNKLHFDFYHPRRSNLAPEGYTLIPYKNKFKKDSPFGFGVTSLVSDFPNSLPKVIDDFYGLSKDISKHAQYCLDTYSFERFEEEATIKTSSFSKKKNDWEKEKLLGKVKSINEATFTAIESFGNYEKLHRMQNPHSSRDKDIVFNHEGYKIIEILYNNLNGKIDSKTHYKYDSKFNIIEERCERNRSFLRGSSEGTAINITLYKYDYKDKIIQMERYQTDGSLDLKFLYKYDDKGRKIEENTYLPDGSFFDKMVYKYDDKGNKIKDIFYNSKGEFSLKNSYIYSKKGNMTEENNYLSDGSLFMKNTYKYDRESNMIKSSQIEPDGSLSNKSIYKYDIKGDVIEEKHYGPNGKLNWEVAVMYQYDKKGNWFKSIQLLDKTHKYIKEREIEYYE